MTSDTYAATRKVTVRLNGKYRTFSVTGERTLADLREQGNHLSADDMERRGFNGYLFLEGERGAAFFAYTTPAGSIEVVQR